MAVDLEIICVGNELLIGKILNTNAQWLSQNATSLGATVKRVTVIPDEIGEIAKAIQEASERKPQFIIITGGLGPTFDDKTLQGLAVALNQKLEVNQKALEMIKQKYQEHAKARQLGTIELTKPRLKMATLPENAEPIHNPVGTAPAVHARLEGMKLFALPGVPSEMEAIFAKTIAPLLKQASGDVCFYQDSLFVFGLFESSLAPLIDKAMNDNKGVYIKSHPTGTETKPQIELHLTITSDIAEGPVAKLMKTKAQLASLIEENGGKVIV